MTELTGRSALVTGGGRGIGRACALRLSAAGARVGLTWNRDEAAALEVSEQIRASGGVCEIVRLSSGDPDSAADAVRLIRERLGPVHILVNNAGIWNRREASAADLEDGDLDQMLDVNLKGVMQVTRCVIPDMEAERWGRVVSIGSTAGVRGEAGHSHYAASKGALLAWSRSLTGELAPQGITCNVVSPGWVLTDMTRSVLADSDGAAIAATIPTGRVSSPDDIAAAVVFLASSDARQISGVNLDVNGGAVFS